MTEKRDKEIQALSIKFETKNKEDQIKLMSQQAKLSAVNLEKATLVRNITIIGIVLSLVIAIFFYNQYRLKQRANSDIAKKNEQLQHLITEKEWLLKEVHHRVKNNLHTVICLLESQAAYLENDALKAIESSQHRIYAMSLIHQKLYQAEDIKTIDMSVYIPEFVQYLGDSFEMSRRIRFSLDIEPLQLGASLAIPLALIINEAVTNSIKYAFKLNEIGVISIKMFRSLDEINLVIADNGIGIDPALTNAHPESLGLKLMNGLSEDINATISIENSGGTKITVKFNTDPLDDKGFSMARLNQEQFN